MESEELFDTELEKLRGFASDSIFQFLSATNDEATPLCSELPFESVQPTYSISPTSTFDAAGLDTLFACSDSYEETRKHPRLEPPKPTKSRETVQRHRYIFSALDIKLQGFLYELQGFLQSFTRFSTEVQGFL